jgi:hypothetical protein
MASIPDFKQNQRIGAPGAVQAVSPNDARAPGEAIQSLGEHAANLAVRVSQYLNVRNASDEALFKDQWSNKAIATGLDAEIAIKTNANKDVAPDGSNMRDILKSKLQPLYDEASQIPDSRRRAVALNAIQNAHLAYGEKLMPTEVAQHNAYTFFQVEQGLRDNVNIVAKDPSQFDARLAQFTETLSKTGIGADNALKLKKEAEKNLVLGVVHGMNEDGNFAGGRDFLRSKGGQYLDEKDTAKLIADSEKQQRMATQAKWTDESHQHTEMVWKRQEQRGSLLDMVMSDMAKAPDIATRRTILDENKDKLGADYNKVSVMGSKISTEQGLPMFNRFLERAATNKNMNSYLDDVMKAGNGANPQITVEQQSKLIKEFNQTNTRKDDKTVYLERRKQAYDMINTAYAKDSFEKSFGDNTKDRQKGIVTQRAMDLWQGGMDPVQAAKKALKEIDPHNSSVIGVPTSKPKVQKPGESIEPTVKDKLKTYDTHASRGILTNSQKLQVLETLKQEKAKRLAAKNAQHNAEVLKDAQVDKVKEGQ